jgi:hypothetical protein
MTEQFQPIPSTGGRPERPGPVPATPTSDPVAEVTAALAAHAKTQRAYASQLRREAESRREQARRYASFHDSATMADHRRQNTASCESEARDCERRAEICERRAEAAEDGLLRWTASENGDPFFLDKQGGRRLIKLCRPIAGVVVES